MVAVANASDPSASRALIYEGADPKWLDGSLHRPVPTAQARDKGAVYAVLEDRFYPRTGSRMARKSLSTLDCFGELPSTRECERLSAETRPVASGAGMGVSEIETGEGDQRAID